MKWLLISGVALLLLAGGGWYVYKLTRPVARLGMPNPPALALQQVGASKLAVSGLVVPHHDLVKQQREDLFKELAPQIEQPKTVILISPNHYDSGQGNIQTTDQPWSLTGGDIAPNKEVISALQKDGASLNPDSFANEHGIKLILPDIHQYFPQASLVPIIFKINTPQEAVDQVLHSLEASCKDCLMVASVDFSHYQPALLGNLHDSLTRRALDNGDASTLLSKAEVDSPPALALLAEWAKLHNTLQFHEQNHTNSGELLKDADMETTTHLYGWYQSGAQTVPDNSVSFLIGGDMMFGRMVAHTYLKDGLYKALDQIGDRTFWGTDAGIVNLEGPVSDVPVPDDIRPNNLVFNFPPQAIGALQYLKVNAASQANNHSANAGAKGLATTRRLLTAANIQPFGGPGDDGIDKVATFAGQGLTLKVIGVHTLSSIPDLAPLIKELKKDPHTRVLVFPHWGVEYRYQHTDSQAAQAHAWIDAGADLVIGAHPHVIEDSELYKGKPIIYSMGNFLFDQDFSTETQEGLFIAGQFTDKGLSLFALPIQDKKYKPSLATNTLKSSLIDRLYTPFAANKQETPAGSLLTFPAQ